MPQPYLELVDGRLVGIFGLPGHWEIVIVILAILLLFGGRKLPELARGMARGLRIFKDEMKGIKTDVEDSVSDDKDQGETKNDSQQQASSSDKSSEGDA